MFPFLVCVYLRGKFLKFCLSVIGPRMMPWGDQKEKEKKEKKEEEAKNSKGGIGGREGREELELGKRTQQA